MFKKKRKVLFTSIGLGSGGVRDSYTYNFVTKEMEALARRGVDVYFFHERFITPEKIRGVNCIGGKWFLEVSRIRILWVLIKCFSQFSRPLFIDCRRVFWAIKISLAVADVVDDLNLTIVHSHFFYPQGLNCAVLRKVVDVPVVSTLRGAELHDRPDLDYGACRDALYRRFLISGLDSADYVTAPNPELVRMLTDHYGVDADKIGLVPNGFETFDANDKWVEEFESSTLNLLSIGNCIALKNHEIVIESVKVLARDHGVAVKLVIVGGGPLTKELMSLSRDAPIVILEEMKKSKLVSYLKAADALVHASFLEGMPNVVLEALSLGTPCLASDISAHRMLIKPELNGYLFDPNDVSSLTKLLLDVSMKKSKLSLMSEGCIEFSKMYSLERKVDRYLGIYEILISGAKKDG